MFSSWDLGEVVSKLTGLVCSGIVWSAVIFNLALNVSNGNLPKSCILIVWLCVKYIELPSILIFSTVGTYPSFTDWLPW